MKKDKIKGGLSDNLTLSDIEKKHNRKSLKRELEMGCKVELEHTDDPKIAKEIAMDHLFEDPEYYNKLKKMEAKEQTTASSSGAVDTTMNKTILKKDLYKMKKSKEQEVDEATDASSSGAFDVPLFGGTKGRKNPLSIGGVKSIGQSRAVKDKNFPKFGGPGGVFVKIKEKCKKFPYCNQGDLKAIEPLRESMEEASKKFGLTIDEVENIILNEIKRIFI